MSKNNYDKNNNSSSNKDHEVDLSGIKQATGVWLVKVPKYLSQQWSRSTEREVGKMNIAKKHGKAEVTFTLSKALSTLSAPGEKGETLQVPREYPFTMTAVGAQNLVAFTETQTGSISLEGVVVQRGECRPAATENYMKMKKTFIAESIKPHRVTEQLEKAVTTVYKPVANHMVNVEYEKKKKAEGRMVRAERQVVLDMLFSAFEKHQYYNIKDLVDITKQPVMYLKEIMREIGVYNTKGAHKSTWEMKPEYSHYQETNEDGEEEEGGGAKSSA